MSVFTNIQVALDTRLAAGSFGIPIVYENVPYSPVAGTSWLRATTLFADAEVVTVSRKERFRGIYQVDVFVELEKGSGDLNTLLDAVRDHFKASLNLTAGSDQIIIRNIGRTAATRDRAWYQGSVEVNFDVFTD